MDKLENFFTFFTPFFWMVGGFILIVNGGEIISSLDGWTKYIVAISVLFMSFGVVGKFNQDINDRNNNGGEK